MKRSFNSVVPYIVSNVVCICEYRDRDRSSKPNIGKNGAIVSSKNNINTTNRLRKVLYTEEWYIYKVDKVLINLTVVVLK